MRVLARVVVALAIGMALVAVAAVFVASQLPSLQGTISIGDGDVTLRGFDDDDGGLAMLVAGLTVMSLMVAAVIAALVAVVVGLGAAALGIGVAIVAVVGSMVLVASPLLLIGALIWLVVREPRRAPATPAAPVVAAS